MSTGADDATQFKIASGLLGAGVEKLIPILRKAEDVTKGYTDAGDVLSEEDAAILRESEMAKKKKELQEKVKTAREEARGKMFEGELGAGRREVMQQLFPTLSEDEMRKKSGGSMDLPGYGRRLNYEGGYRKADTYVKEKLTEAERDLVMKEYAAREAARKAAENEAKNAAAKEAAAQLQAIADAEAGKKDEAKRLEEADAIQLNTLDEEEKRLADEAKAKKKADEDKAKSEKEALGKALDAEAKAAADPGKFTGSSLRDIGGALAAISERLQERTIENDAEQQSDVLGVENMTAKSDCA
jgi:colicin import membrane protein